MKETIAAIISSIVCLCTAYIWWRRRLYIHKTVQKENAKIYGDIVAVFAGILVGLAIFHALVEALIQSLLAFMHERVVGAIRSTMCAFLVGFLLPFFTEHMHQKHDIAQEGSKEGQEWHEWIKEIQIATDEEDLENENAEKVRFRRRRIVISDKNDVDETETEDSSILVESSEQEKNQYRLQYKSELLSFVFLCVSLNLHAFLVGIAISLSAAEAYSVSKNILFALAFAIHKCIDTTILVKSLINLNVSKIVFCANIALFSVTVPLGVLIGTQISSFSAEAQVAIAWLRAFIGGMFFNIAIFELLIERAFVEYGHRLHRTILFLFALGVVMCTSPFM